MPIAALSSAGFPPDSIALQKAPLPPSPVEGPTVETRNYRTLDRTAALVKDEYDVSSYPSASVSSEEIETEGLSVYA